MNNTDENSTKQGENQNNKDRDGGREPIDEATHHKQRNNVQHDGPNIEQKNNDTSITHTNQIVV